MANLYCENCGAKNGETVSEMWNRHNVWVIEDDEQFQVLYQFAKETVMLVAKIGNDVLCSYCVKNAFAFPKFDSETGKLL